MGMHGPASTDERWAPVAGWEGVYSVSDKGRVRSEERRAVNSQNGGTRRVRERLLKQRPDGSGYLYVMLMRPGIRVVAKVASLVAEAFIGPRPIGFQVCHGDGNRTNNTRGNLRYDTRKGNMADCLKHGTRYRGEKHHKAKLTDDMVKQIRADTRACPAISEDYGISAGHVWAVKTGKARKYVA